MRSYAIALSDADAEHGDRAAVERLDRIRARLLASALREHVDEREEMVGRRRGESGIAAQLLVSHHGLQIVLVDGGPDDLLETQGPVVRLDRVSAPGVGVQVV